MLSLECLYFVHRWSWGWAWSRWAWQGRRESARRLVVLLTFRTHSCNIRVFILDWCSFQVGQEEEEEEEEAGTNMEATSTMEVATMATNNSSTITPNSMDCTITEYLIYTNLNHVHLCIREEYNMATKKCVCVCVHNVVCGSSCETCPMPVQAG